MSDYEDINMSPADHAREAWEHRFDERDEREPETEPVWMPCVICGINDVCVTDGDDTCMDCIKRI